MKREMKWNRILVSLAIGVIIFIWVLFNVGIGSSLNILQKVNIFYLLLFFLVSFIGFLSVNMRLKTILKAHGKDLKFFMLLRQTIARFSVSYITSASMFGGEPLRVYMLKKEAGVDYKTGTSAIIIDNFIDIAASMVFVIAEAAILFYFVPIPLWIRVISSTVIILLLIILLVFYLRTVKGKNSFSYFLNLCFSKKSKLKRFVVSLEEVEKKMQNFFVNHKKAFFISCFWDFTYTIIIILEIKVLLLALGINAGIFLVLLVLAVRCFANLIPIPGGLGVSEGSQESLLRFFLSSNGAGFVLALLIRIRDIFFTLIGFFVIYRFSVRLFENKKNFKKIKIANIIKGGSS